MNVDYRRVLKVISLPLILFLLIPFADVYFWWDSFLRDTRPLSELLCLYWLEHPAFTLRCLPLYAIPDILEIILLVRWGVNPCLRTGVWLTIGTYFILGDPLYIFAIAGGFFFR